VSQDPADSTRGLLRPTLRTVRTGAIGGAATLALAGCGFAVVTAPLAFIGLGNTTTIADVIFNICALSLVGTIVGGILGTVVGFPIGLIISLWRSARPRTPRE